MSRWLAACGPRSGARPAPPEVGERKRVAAPPDRGGRRHPPPPRLGPRAHVWPCSSCCRPLRRSVVMPQTCCAGVGARNKRDPGVARSTRNDLISAVLPPTAGREAPKATPSELRAHTALDRTHTAQLSLTPFQPHRSKRALRRSLLRHPSYKICDV